MIDCFIDLHIHLDGAISLKSARQLAAVQNIILPSDDSELEKMMTVESDCRDLNEFLEKFEFIDSLLQTEESIRIAIGNLTRELYEQGVVYAEIRFAPQKHTLRGMTQEDAVVAALEGINNSPLCARLILCCMRDKSNIKENTETVELAAKYKKRGVAGIDLAGAEAIYPTENFEYVFKKAKEQGVPFTVHAGEAAGAESVRYALLFGAQRIGHGVRAIESNDVTEELRRKNILVEMCLSSNLVTKAIRSTDEFPFRKFLNMNIPVSVNTDDPEILRTSVKKEYQKIYDLYSMSDEEMRLLILSALEHSFLNPSDPDYHAVLNKIAEKYN